MNELIVSPLHGSGQTVAEVHLLLTQCGQLRTKFIIVEQK